MQPYPFYSDGRAALGEPIIECLNLTGDGTTYQRYEYLSDNIDRESVDKEHTNPDANPLGSFTSEGFEKGSINVQLTKVSHKIPRPSHIIHCDFGNGAEYYIAGKFGRSRTRREVVKGALAVKRSYSPIVVSLLSEAYGQMKAFTQAAGALAGTVTDAPEVVNTRAGAVLAYSMAARPGYVIPDWLAINAATGVLSGISVAGHWQIEIIVTDTVAGADDLIGYGIIDLTIT